MLARRSPYGATSAEPVTDPGSFRWWIPDLGFAALRVAIGLLVVWHGAQEYFGVLLAPHQPWTGALTPFSDPWIVATVRLMGGLLLTVGLFTQPAAVVLAALVALIQLEARGTPGYWTSAQGELAVLYLVVLLAFAAIGPGIISLDARVRGRRARRRDPGMTVEMSSWVRRQYRRRDPSR